MIQYANTITDLPDYQVMKSSLETVFGETAEISFEDIEHTKQTLIGKSSGWSLDTYTDIEYGNLTNGVDGIKINQEDNEEEVKEGVEEGVKEKGVGPGIEEVTQMLSKWSWSWSFRKRTNLHEGWWVEETTQ